MGTVVEHLLEQWLEALQAGQDPHQVTWAAQLALTEAGAPTDVVKEVARLGTIAQIDKKLKLTGWDEKQVTLLNAVKTILAAGAPPEQIMPLVEMARDVGRVGRTPRKLGYRTTLATFAAAVTVLKKGRTVDAAVAEIATPNGISRKDIKNYRNRINRGLITDGSQGTYKLMLATFQRMSREEIMSILAGTAERFCT
jgi:hypothetical protein